MEVSTDGIVIDSDVFSGQVDSKFAFYKLWRCVPVVSTVYYIHACDNIIRPQLPDMLAFALRAKPRLGRAVTKNVSTGGPSGRAGVAASERIRTL